MFRSLTVLFLLVWCEFDDAGLEWTVWGFDLLLAALHRDDSRLRESVSIVVFQSIDAAAAIVVRVRLLRFFTLRFVIGGRMRCNYA